MTLDEFAREFLQDVLAESDADGEFMEDVFFQKSCEHLMEAGELDSRQIRAPYRRSTRSRGIRVDGYGGDPAQSTTRTPCVSLSWISSPRRTGRTSGRIRDERHLPTSVRNFLRHALDRKWRDALEETSPAFGLADSDRPVAGTASVGSASVPDSPIAH